MNYKVMIVEDELPILNNIVRKLNKLSLPVEVAAAATSAQDALELFPLHQPHILITDIRMPGMSGLDLCRQISAQYPQTKMVILSGYNEFAYAQQAIRCGVSEYLLKPVNTSVLRETIQRLLDRLEQEDNVHQKRTLSLGIAGQFNTKDFPSSFGSKPLGIFLICLENSLANADRNIDVSHFNQLWDRVRLDDFLAQLIYGENRFWILPEKRPNECFVITSFFDPQLPQKLCGYIKKRLGPDSHVNLCAVSKGICYQDIWHTAQAERVFLRSNLVPCRSCIYYADAPVANPTLFDDFLVQMVLRGIQKREKTAYSSALHSCLQALHDLPASQNALEQVTERILKELWNHGFFEGESVFPEILSSAREKIYLAADYELLYTQLENWFNLLFLQTPGNDLNGEGLACAVQKYIDENYREAITIESLADTFHFSAAYIGRVFRNTFHVSPIKYLTLLRIKHACRLIRDTPSLNINMLSEMVGYNDSRYFSRVFRNVTGMTPTEYKNSLQNH